MTEEQYMTLSGLLIDIGWLLKVWFMCWIVLRFWGLFKK